MIVAASADCHVRLYDPRSTVKWSGKDDNDTEQ